MPGVHGNSGYPVPSSPANPPTAPQLGLAYGVPQSVGHGSHIHQGTNPQLGVPQAAQVSSGVYMAAAAAAAGGPRTDPKFGTPGHGGAHPQVVSQVFRPGASVQQFQSGIVQPHCSAPGTNPQMQSYAGVQQQGSIPKMHGAVVPAHTPVPLQAIGEGAAVAFSRASGFFSGAASAAGAAMSQLWDARTSADIRDVLNEGGHDDSEVELVEVVLECSYALGMDVSRLPARHKCIVLKRGDSPWLIGRQQQPNFFARTVLDEVSRGTISRSHFELFWEDPWLKLKRLSQNPLVVNGEIAQVTELVLLNQSEIGFCGMEVGPPFLVIRVRLRDSKEIAALGATPLPTHPDVPAPSLPHAQPCRSPLMRSAHPAPFSLICVHAQGHPGVGALPAAARTIAAPPDAKLTVGRQHQPGFFEGLLSDPRHMAFISRSHFEIASFAAEAGSFTVKNLSGNPLVLGGQQHVTKNECVVVRLQ